MNNGVTFSVNVDELLLQALKEDITSEDITTNAIISTDQVGCAELLCKEDGILCGISVFCRVFELLDSSFSFSTTYQDGDPIKKGEVIGHLTGSIRALLSGERTALNYLQRMCGIATKTKEYATELEGSSTKLLDTRKTTPNMRIFEKYAVKIGGGYNHRYNLSDGILLKDNHISAAGSITNAIKRAKDYAPFVRKIEVEVETLAMVDEALIASADIIMLDNMDNETIKEAIKRIGNQAQTECSGNITKERLKELAQLGIDFISCGALTHSAPILDLSLKNLYPIS